MKTFKGDFELLLNKLKNNEHFAFIRFSDGELFVLQNKRLELSERGTFVDNTLCGPVYGKEDFKFFDPQEHQWFQKKLAKSLEHKQHNYFVGLSCACCVGVSNYIEMQGFRQGHSEFWNRAIKDDFVTWANLFVNSNYPRFVSEFIPELGKKKIVLICNEKADLSNSKMIIEKDFRIGRNAMIENANLHEEIGKWIEENKIENHVFLFSASSLTNITVHELFQRYPKNTYLDIGTTLNPVFGFPASRGYLQAFWSSQSHPDLQKVCIWL